MNRICQTNPVVGHVNMQCLHEGHSSGLFARVVELIQQCTEHQTMLTLHYITVTSPLHHPLIATVNLYNTFL